MKEFGKSVIIWLSYGQELGVLFFLTHGVEPLSINGIHQNTSVVGSLFSYVVLSIELDGAMIGSAAMRPALRTGCH